MTPAVSVILVGDALERLRAMPSDSVHCIVTSQPYFRQRHYLRDDHPSKAMEIGTEATPAEYVQRVVAVLREARRVLRPDGLMWLNIGDSFASTSTYNAPRTPNGAYGRAHGDIQPNAGVPPGIKAKEIIGIPWMLAFALRDDGWMIRQENIWEKPNGFTESVKDRCTRNHEYVFQLFKHPTYYYDWLAVAEPIAESSRKRIAQESFDSQKGGPKDYRDGTNPNRSARKALENFAASNGGVKNRRSVWRIHVRPIREAHTATFPPELPRLAIAASTSEGGCCAHCGSPLRRVTARGEPDEAWRKACGADSAGEYHGTSQKGQAEAGAQDASGTKARILEGMKPYVTVGWKRACSCPSADPVPALVLDPFCGSGTTLMVARELGRDSVGIDISEDFADMAERRIGGDVYRDWIWKR